jgi:hypothetical protein
LSDGLAHDIGMQHLEMLVDPHHVWSCAALQEDVVHYGSTEHCYCFPRLYIDFIFVSISRMLQCIANRVDFLDYGREVTSAGKSFVKGNKSVDHCGLSLPFNQVAQDLFSSASKGDNGKKVTAGEEEFRRDLDLPLGYFSFVKAHDDYRPLTTRFSGGPSA